MEPLKVEKQRTITEYAFVCPKCLNKSVVGVEEIGDLDCTNATCDYVLDKQFLDGSKTD